MKTATPDPDALMGMLTRLKLAAIRDQLPCLSGSARSARARSYVPRFFCDYGPNIRLGDGVFLNYNCVFLDVVTIVVSATARKSDRPYRSIRRTIRGIPNCAATASNSAGR